MFLVELPTRAKDTKSTTISPMWPCQCQTDSYVCTENRFTQTVHHRVCGCNSSCCFKKWLFSHKSKYTFVFALRKMEKVHRSHIGIAYTLSKGSCEVKGFFRLMVKVHKQRPRLIIHVTPPQKMSNPKNYV